MRCKECCEPMPKIDQSLASCIYCEKDLSEEANGTEICVECANSRQKCQCCGRSLRIGDFPGIYTENVSVTISRAKERQIIAALLHSKK